MKNEDNRKRKMQVLLQSVISCGSDGASKKKIVAIMGVEFGTSRRTALEYIDCLKFADKLVEQEGLLYGVQHSGTVEESRPVATEVY